MRQATHAHTTTPASTTRRAAHPAGGVLDRRLPPDLPTKGTIRPTAAHFFGGAIIPDSYAAPLSGTCLEPVMFDGDMALVSPTALPQVGDLVVMYHVKGGIPWLKRLVMAPLFPIRPPHPLDEVVPIVVVEMLTPPKQFMFGSDQLKAMHRVVELIRKDEVEALRNLPPQPVPKPARRRKAVAA